MKRAISLLLILFFAIVLYSESVMAKTLPYKITKESDGIYIVEINTAKNKNLLIPYVVEGLETNEKIYKDTGAKLAVNAGFFDPKNKKTVSYVVIDNKEVVSPKDNENLMENKVLEPYMDKILNRSEFRILEDEAGKLTYDIAPHEDIIPTGYKLLHSIQAGPMLFPDLRLEEEFFILKKDNKIVSESASCLHKYARTAIGIKNNTVYLFIITNENPMTLEEVAELAKKWDMEKAMAFDGGGSTSFNTESLSVISEKDKQARKLKSFLILK